MLDVLLQVRPGPGGAGGPDVLILAINLVSVGLLMALLVLFGQTWRKTRAPFSLGLVLFAGVLLLEDVARVAGAFGLLRTRGAVVLPEFLELAALVVLLYLATR
jgi:hypothetical protein